MFFVDVPWASAGDTSNVKGDEQFFAVPDFEKVRQDEASVQPTLEALGKEDNELRRKLMVMVVLGSYGRKDISLLVLQKAASFAPEEAKAWYKKATDMLNGWQIEDNVIFNRKKWHALRKLINAPALQITGAALHSAQSPARRSAWRLP